MKRFFLLFPLLAAGCATTTANLQRMDHDRNGTISRGEFTDAVAEGSFRAMDRNGDGMVDLGEWRSAEGGNEGMFRLRDMSRNGHISWPEARLAAEKNAALVGLFSRIDTNRDGAIDHVEARRYQSTLR